jgi:hypothetical protein
LENPTGVAEGRVDGPAEIARSDLPVDVLVGFERVDVRDLEVGRIAAERAHGLEHLRILRNHGLDRAQPEGAGRYSAGNQN